jgi:Uma2 family endonuclease
MAHNLTQPDALIPPDLTGLTNTVTPEQFERLCRKYSELRLELTSTGELIVMPGTGFETGVRNANLTRQLDTWATKDGNGLCCDSSTIFALPNGARRSPDASWVKREKVNSLSERQKKSFAPICPDFVAELRSESDRFATLHSKMLEYIANGALLGWLIDPQKRRVYVYKPDEELVVLEAPEIVSGDPVLPGFELKMERLW